DGELRSFLDVVAPGAAANERVHRNVGLPGQKKSPRLVRDVTTSIEDAAADGRLLDGRPPNVRYAAAGARMGAGELARRSENVTMPISAERPINGALTATGSEKC